MKLQNRNGHRHFINRHNYLTQSDEDKSLRNASVSKVQVLNFIFNVD